MKRLRDLTPADLENVAVWHYVGDNDDVAHVRAADRAALSDDNAGAFIARTQFVLANGAQFVGFCSPSVRETSLECVQPVILTRDGPVYFFFEVPPSHETLDAQWKRLGTGHEAIFPIHFRCTVPVDGTFVTGTIEAEDLTGAA